MLNINMYFNTAHLVNVSSKFCSNWSRLFPGVTLVKRKLIFKDSSFHAYRSDGSNEKKCELLLKKLLVLHESLLGKVK